HAPPTPVPYTTLFRSFDGVSGTPGAATSQRSAAATSSAASSAPAIFSSMMYFPLAQLKRKGSNSYPHPPVARPSVARWRVTVLRSEEHTSELQSLRHL